MHQLILQNVGKHVTLTAEEADFFCSLLTVKKVRKKQFLIHAGSECRFEYFVNKGCLRQYYLDNKGQEHTLMFAPEDWWSGDMYGFINKKPSLTTIQALEDSEVLAIERAGFETLVATVPKFERFFRILLQRAFVAHQRRLIESMSLGIKERYESFIQQYPSLEKRISQRHLAYYLGVTPESLSRIKSAAAKHQ
jgi:CRP-like cAMP-binding protein